jgi:hypothetical protein
VLLWKLTKTKTHTAFLLAKPMPPNINLSSDRFAIFNKKRDISSKTASRSLKCRLTTPPDQLRHPISRLAPLVIILVVAALNADDVR